jgi:hypothetical protein
MKTFASVIAAAFCLAVSPLAVFPAIAEYLFYRNSSVLADHQQLGVPLTALTATISPMSALARWSTREFVRASATRTVSVKLWRSTEAER